MKVVALVSGGKDSCYNMIKCVDHGHTIVAMANLHPSPDQSDELDSFMYQTVGYQALDKYAEAIGIPLYRREIRGKPVNQTDTYDGLDGDDEVEDLYHLLVDLKEKEGIDFDAISVGAIWSKYQYVRAANVCKRLNLKVLAYLWEMDQEVLIQQMIDDGIEAILIKTAVMGLEPDKHLGKTLKEMKDTLIQLKEKYGINVCGEGGEYETLTLNCPLFKKQLRIDESEIVIHSDVPFAPVGYLRPLKISLIEK